MVGLAPRAPRAPPPLDDGRPRHPLAPALPEALRPHRAGPGRGARRPPGDRRGVPALASRALSPRDGRGHREGSRRLPHLPARRRHGPTDGLRGHARAGRGGAGRGGRLARSVVGARAGPARAAPGEWAPGALHGHDPAVALRFVALAPRPCGRLFDFEYRIEVYTPGPKRVHGYYTLPILHDGHLIGRLDAKTHRAEKQLEVLHVHFESWLARERRRLSPARSWIRTPRSTASPRRSCRWAPSWARSGSRLGA